MQTFHFILEWQFWKSALEVFILAAGIYYVLKFLRGTRGASVLMGLALLLLTLTLVTRLLRLDTINWILSWFFGFFAIALLIIFQPELRRVLAELGSRQFFTSGRRGREVIDTVGATAESLASRRLGGLIAFEGSIGFRGIVESGTPMDSHVSSELLMTIFAPNTPLHDGGVVIRGDRIAAAACIFPLSEKRGLEAELGTRHRAALGLTEETDAVVVVVSEESGTISVAHRGELQRGLDRAELCNLLERLLLYRQSSAARWFDKSRRWFGLAEEKPAVEKTEPSRGAATNAPPSIQRSDRHLAEKVE
jgi:diadenylate cyclase